MLQGMQAKGDEVRGIGDADNAEDAAFLLQLVIVEGMRGRRMGQGKCSDSLGQLRVA